MKTYSIFDAPIKVYGVPFFEKEHRFLRMATVIRPVLEKALNTSKIN